MKNITLKPTPSGLPALGHQGQPLLAPRVMGGGDSGGRSSGACWSALPNAMQKSWVPALVWTTAAKNQAGNLQSGHMHKPEALQSTWDSWEKKKFVCFLNGY